VFYRTQQMTTNYDLWSALITTLSTRPAGALLATPTVRLFTDTGLTITPATLLTAFHEADFDGYVAAAISAWVGPVLNAQSSALLHQEADFIAGSAIAPGQAVYGYYITDDPATKWYFAEVFRNSSGTPIAMQFAAPGDYLSVDVAAAVMMQLQLNL